MLVYIPHSSDKTGRGRLEKNKEQKFTSLIVQIKPNVAIIRKISRELFTSLIVQIKLLNELYILQLQQCLHPS